MATSSTDTRTAQASTDNYAGDYLANGLTPDEKRKYIALVQQAHDRGEDVSGQLGQDLKIVDGRVQAKNFWDRSKRDLLNMAILVGSGIVAGEVMAALGPTQGTAATAAGQFAGPAGYVAPAGGTAAATGTGAGASTIGGLTGGTAAGSGTAASTAAGLTVPMGTLATDVGVTAAPTLASVGTAGLAPALPAAGGSSLMAAGGTAAATSPGVFGQFTRALSNPGVQFGIGTGVNLLGGWMQSRAANDATEASERSAREALDVQTQMYNQNMGLNVDQANQNTQAYNTTLANLNPYRQAGASSLSMLGAGLGLPGYMGGEQTVLNQPPPSQPVAPLDIPPPIQMPGSTPVPNRGVPTPPPTTAVPRGTAPTAPAPAAPNGAPQPGERRMINGQVGEWDAVGRGWKAVQ